MDPSSVVVRLLLRVLLWKMDPDLMAPLGLHMQWWKMDPG